MDKISGERRSYNMSRIRSSDTRIELALRKALWRNGVRGYRVHRRDLPGRPDLVFGRWKIAVFVDGCFWHACEECFVAPSTNTAYWAPKIARNAERDVEASLKLQQAGWSVLRFWEHEVEQNVEAVASAIEATLRAAGWEPMTPRGPA